MRALGHIGKGCLPTVVLLALGAMPTLADEHTVAKGRAILESNCSRCHAVGLSGTSPLAAAPPFRTLSQKYPVDSLAEALAEGIVTGHNAMPKFVFSPEQIGAILDYLNAINAPRSR